MKDGFTRKKVESLTLGEKLKKLRSDLRMSLSEVSKATRIQVKYLEYLENGQYEKLPADVYVRGFLRSYARYLNIDEQALVKIYERERNIHANLGRDIPKKTFDTAKLRFSPFVITPRSVALTMIFLLVGGAFFYLYREFQSFAGAPRLVILDLTDGMTVDASEIIVRGKTDTGARVSINNQPVFVSSDGAFSDTLILQPGFNTVTVIAINRFDKERSETFSLEARYTPAAPDATIEMAARTKSGTFSLDVVMRDVPADIVLKADGTIVFSGVLKPGEIQATVARESIEITSDNATKTFVRFNGEAEDVLGSEAAAARVIFTAAGRQR